MTQRKPPPPANDRGRAAGREIFVATIAAYAGLAALLWLAMIVIGLIWPGAKP